MVTLQEKPNNLNIYIEYNIKSESPDRKIDVQTVTFALLLHTFYFLFYLLIFKLLNHIYCLINTCTQFS